MVDFLTAGIILAGVAALLVYSDAKGKNIDGAGMYALATFLVLIVGLPLYIYERSKHPTSARSSHSSVIAKDEAIEIARNRFARGEISAEEFDYIREQLKK